MGSPLSLAPCSSLASPLGRAPANCLDNPSVSGFPDHESEIPPDTRAMNANANSGSDPRGGVLQLGSLFLWKSANLRVKFHETRAN